MNKNSKKHGSTSCANTPVSLHKNSKKIKKTTPTSTPQTNKETRKYATFENEAKTTILIKLQKELFSKLKLEFCEETLDLQRLLEEVEKASLEVYNKILKKILQKYVFLLYIILY